MKTTYPYLILLLILLFGCSHNESVTVDNDTYKEFVVHTTSSPQADIAPSHEATTDPSPSKFINNEEDITAKLLWLNMNGELIHEHDVSDATFLESVRSPNHSNSLVIHNITSQFQLLDLNTHEVVEVNTPTILDSDASFGNDYGAYLLFAGRVDEPVKIIVSGNKTVFTYDELGKPNNIYEANKPIYGSALSPNNQLLALLIASDDFIGPEADLIVLDLQGKVVFEKQRISYISHSDGFNFLYPMEWTNNCTVAVPLIASGISENDRYYHLINIKNDTVTLESESTLSEAAFILLSSKLQQLEPFDIINVFAKPSDEQERYITVTTSTQTKQVWLIDLLDEKVTLLSEGIAIGWNDQNELILLQTESIVPYYAKLNLN